MRTYRHASLRLAVVFAISIGPSAQGADVFALGNLPSFGVSGEGLGVSDDGGTVVGYTTSTVSNEGYLWTQDSGILALGFLSSQPDTSIAEALSATGQSIVGWSQSDQGREAFLWTPQYGMVGLGDLPGGTFDSFARDISDDGSVVVGLSRSASAREIFRWTEAEGMVGLGIATSSNNSPVAISGDGTVVVGESNGNAFRWTQANGVTLLGSLPTGEVMQQATDVSIDGSFIVGEGRMRVGTGSNSRFHQRAFFWREGEGIIELGDLPGGSTHTHAYGVSDDGSTVVGSSGTELGSHAFVWNEDGGMQRLYNILDDGGVDLSHWTSFGTINAISADGRWVTGRGVNIDGDYESFLADLYFPIAGDFDGDGFVGVADLDILLANWGQTVDPGAIELGDLVVDGQINQDDLAALIDLWGNGTPPDSQVPEPGTLAGLLLVGGLLARRRR